MVTKKVLSKWLEQFDDNVEIDYTVSLFAEEGVAGVHLLDMDTGKSYTDAEPPALEDEGAEKVERVEGDESFGNLRSKLRGE